MRRPRDAQAVSRRKGRRRRRRRSRRSRRRRRKPVVFMVAEVAEKDVGKRETAAGGTPTKRGERKIREQAEAG